MLKCPWKQQQCCEEAARENCSTVLLLLLSFHSLLMYRDVRVKLESNETRNDNGFWLKVKTPQTPQSAFPVRHIKDSTRPWASIFPLLSFWTAAASARCIPKMLCVFPSLLLSPLLPPILNRRPTATSGCRASWTAHWTTRAMRPSTTGWRWKKPRRPWRRATACRASAWETATRTTTEHTAGLSASLEDQDLPSQLTICVLYCTHSKLKQLKLKWHFILRLWNKMSFSTAAQVMLTLASVPCCDVFSLLIFTYSIKSET